MLTKYGASVWVTCSIVLLGLVGLAAWLCWPVAVIPAILWLWVLWFFRDPNRSTPNQEGLFVSPADGTVTDITPIGSDSPLGCDGMRVGVFMSVFSVHVNRSACDGVVDRVVHHKGVFLDARNALARERNESTDIFLTHSYRGKQYPIVIRQVSGFIARKIVTRIDSGQEIKRGQRFGMIRFGSRCELLVPSELAKEVCVQIGEKVSAGITVLISTGSGSIS